jgi:hypothetical protein
MSKMIATDVLEATSKLVQLAEREGLGGSRAPYLPQPVSFNPALLPTAGEHDPVARAEADRAQKVKLPPKDNILAAALAKKTAPTPKV